MKSTILKLGCGLIFLIILNCNLIALESNTKDSLKVAELFKESNEIWSPNGPFKKNIELLTKAELLCHNMNNYERQVEALLKLATVHFYNFDALNYEKSTIKADSIAREFLQPNHEYFTYIYANFSRVYRLKRMYGRAIEYCERGLEFITSKSNGELCYLFNEIAKNYLSMGDYHRAEEYINLAIESNYDPYSANVEFDSYSELAKIYERKGQKLLALETFIRSLNVLVDSNSDLNEIIQSYTLSIARRAFDQDQGDLGEEYLKRALVHYESFTTYTKAIYYQVLASRELNKSNGDLQLVTSNILKSIELMDTARVTGTSLDVSIAVNYEKLGDVWRDVQEFQKSISYYNKALEQIEALNLLDLPKLIKNKDLTLKYLDKILSIYLEQEDIDSTKKLIPRILKIIRAFRIENTTASHKNFWANQNLTLFEKAIGFYFNQGDKEACFSLIEENKSNLLAQEINDANVKGYSNIPIDLLESEKTIKQEISFIELEIDAFGTNEVQDSTVLTNLKLEKSKKKIELETLDRQLEKEYPDYYQLKYDVSPTTLSDAQGLLSSNQALIEYFIGKEQGYVFLVTEDEVHIVELKDVDRLKESLASFTSDVKQEKLHAGDELYSLLGLEILEHLDRDINSLIIVGDDLINNIPFEAIKNPKDQYLLEAYNIQYQYSVKLLKLLKERKSKNYKYDFVGYAYHNDTQINTTERSCRSLTLGNLSCSKKEVEVIMDHLEKGKNKVIDGSMNDFIANAADSKIIHLATHACLDNTDSDLSRIYFNDNYLTLKDLQVSDFKSELVVLSACETGFGEVIEGEGTMSLSKGFFHAGAKSTLVSLWSVDDCRTAELMTYFYSSLKDGKPKDVALREAKVQYLESANPEKQHPYYWAGFVLIGDTAPIVNTSISMYLILILAAILIFTLWLMRIFTRKG